MHSKAAGRVLLFGGLLLTPLVSIIIVNQHHKSSLI